MSRAGRRPQPRPIPIDPPEPTGPSRPTRQPDVDYLQIFQSCVDKNIVGRGSFHVLLKDHGKIPKGYYCRIGFMPGTSDDPQGFGEIKRKRLAWSRAIREQKFCIPSKFARIHILSREEEKTLEFAMKRMPLGKYRLRGFYNEHITKGNSALFGEMVKAATGDVRSYLDSLRLTAEEERKTFVDTLTKLHANVKLYIEFVVDRLARNGWSSFTFDLKAKNALMYAENLDEGTPRPVLCDLDAEEENCFSQPSGYSRRSLPEQKKDADLCKLFVKDNVDVLSLAAFIILTLNSITRLRHRRHGEHEASDQEEKSGHEHKSCPQYLVTNVVHNILKEMRKHDPFVYQKKIKKLFEIMTSGTYWGESMQVITWYLRLPRDSPGSKTAWALSTSEGSDNPVGATNAFRKRWLMLLFLNFYKCRSCEKPRDWFLKDLLNPMWEDLGIKSISDIEIHLSRGFLERDAAVEMAHKRTYDLINHLSL